MSLTLTLPSLAAAAACPDILRTLAYGMRGTDVAALQQVLIADDLLPADSATGYFGALTQQALQLWQRRTGIVSEGTPETTGFGVAGRRTRAAIGARCVPAQSTSGNAEPSQIDALKRRVDELLSLLASLRVETAAASATSAASQPLQPPPTSQPSPTNPTVVATSSAVKAGSTASATLIGTTTASSTPALSCTWNGTTIPSGGSITAYQSATAAAPQTCTSQIRTCQNGVLSGTYTFSTCTVTNVTGVLPRTPLVGYWMIGPRHTLTDYIAETASVSNVAVIPPDDNNQFIPRIQKAETAGVKTMLMIGETMFKGNVLQPDYKARFDKLWASLDTHQATVAGFYLTDEPYWNNQNSAAPIPESQVRDNLNAATAYIHEKAPGRPVAITEAYPIVSRPDYGSLLPSSLDYIGVNCYLAFGNVCSESAITSLIAKLVSVKSSSQKLIITADGFWPTQPTAAQDSALLARIKFWETLLAPYFASDTIGAFTPFIYETMPTGNVHGIVEAPQALAEMQQYMASIRNNTLPKTRNLALGGVATASGTYQTQVPARAFDGIATTSWNSGGFPKQWIQVDLGASRTIQSMTLKVTQLPAGTTTHMIYGGSTSAGPWKLLTTFAGKTANGQILSYAPPAPITATRFIRIETTVSPSWVAWSDIEINGY